MNENETTVDLLPPALDPAVLEPYPCPPPRLPEQFPLDRNEGPPPPPALLEVLASVRSETLLRYPDTDTLLRRLAARHEVDPERVLVTAGAGDALERCARLMLGPGREVLLPAPTFEMLPRSARGQGASIRRVPWPGGAFPAAEFAASVRAHTALAVIVSPNNPTGAVADPAAIDAVAAAASRALVVLDLTYVEFADHDPMPAALRHRNVVAVRTFSKSRGLAGLRVGCAIGPAATIRRLRAAGAPYPVSALSVLLAGRALELDPALWRAGLGRVRREREELTAILAAAGARPLPSQANFVLAAFEDAAAVAAGLARAGVAVRCFPGRQDLAPFLRITCPGAAGPFRRLREALARVLPVAAGGGR